MSPNDQILISVGVDPGPVSGHVCFIGPAETVIVPTPTDAAIAEGIEKSWDGSAHWYKDYSSNAAGQLKQQPIRSFGTLWESINAKRGFGWDINPWVWAVEFKVVPQEATT